MNLFTTTRLFFIIPNFLLDHLGLLIVSVNVYVTPTRIDVVSHVSGWDEQPGVLTRRSVSSLYFIKTTKT